MIFRIRILLGGFIILSLCAIAFEVYVKSTDDGEDDSSLLITENKDALDGKSKMSKVSYSQTAGGKTVFKLEAIKAELFPDYVELKNVGAQFFSDDGSVYNARSKNALYYEKEGKVNLSGNVVILSSGGYKFSSNNINYDLASMIGTSSEEVSMEAPGIAIEGKGLRLNVKDKSFSLSENVEALITEEAVKAIDEG